MAYNGDINDFLGLKLENDKYKVIKYIASGAVGHMFKCRNEEFEEDRAVKFIPVEKLKDGWENEIKKANQLHHQENIVGYRSNGKIIVKDVEYLYIMWDYIDNNTLHDMIDSHDLTVVLLLEVINTILKVFHACQDRDVIHADLHEGNVLIQKVSSINIDTTYRKVWITDFSRVTIKSGVAYKDDYTGLINIITNSLNSIKFHELDGENKRIYSVIKNEFIKDLRETNPLIDGSARNPRSLIEKLQKILHRSQEKANSNTSNTIEINDYLAAEHLGDNFEEWKALFVPQFIATNELLSKNICVLTGLRGCGKTMLFKRLSAYFNEKLEGPANLPGSDQFYGFYLNARDIGETFPWLPEDKENKATNQVIHNFNLKWTLEILIWIREKLQNMNYNLTFLNDYFSKYFPDYFSANAENSIYFLIEKIKVEINISRLQSEYHSKRWTLIDLHYLEEFVILIKEKFGFIEDKPFYFFLDDYSLPMIKPTIQHILNPIIFRRSANIIFKISTESPASFEKTGLNKKPLEENDDYSLIDCGILTLYKKESECREIIFQIIQQRIECNSILKNKGLTIEKMLGKTLYNDEERANAIRKDLQSNEKSTKYLYQGWDVFCKMWTSDVREMINYFAEMISIEGDIEKAGYRISDETQNKVYKDSGGLFMSLLNSATNPLGEQSGKENMQAYAGHLKEIVESFHELASFELKNKEVKNQNTNPIKKARKIEVFSVGGELDLEAKSYYQGLIRYGIFIQDNRAKSVRGKIALRLFLRSRLIPYFRLTFSKHDNISMSWDEFKQFLLKPKEFVTYYKGKAKMSNAADTNGQGELFVEVL